ncbi:MAG: DUF4404 family protein [Burkholderiaceae bacterium]
MPIDNLKDTLKKLHANLESTSTVDAELKTLLKVLDSDIQNLLAKKEDAASDVPDLVTRAQSLSAKFATEHPQLEQVMRELADTLARMGI